ncbi:capsular polysaccharide synthesis protein [Hansschlegelia beijingensis]
MKAPRSYIKDLRRRSHHYEAGAQALLNNDDAKARIEFDRGLESDALAPTLAPKLLSETPRKFLHKYVLAQFVEDGWRDWRQRVTAESRSPAIEPPKIYTYWGQGFHEAPPVVKACESALRRFHTDHELALLDEKAIPYYVDIPSDVRLSIGPTRYAAFTDLLRVTLLARYGGVWLDANCLATRNIISIHEDLTQGSDFFAFPLGGDGRISSWCLASKPGSYLACMMREAQQAYWRAFSGPVIYLFFHFIFRCLVLLDPDFGTLWARCPRPEGNPRALSRRVFLRSFAADEVEERVRRSFVLKLSHKVDAAKLAPDSAIASLVRRSATIPAPYPDFKKPETSVAGPAIRRPSVDGR